MKIKQILIASIILILAGCSVFIHNKNQESDQRDGIITNLYIVDLNKNLWNGELYDGKNLIKFYFTDPEEIDSVKKAFFNHSNITMVYTNKTVNKKHKFQYLIVNE